MVDQKQLIAQVREYLMSIESAGFVYPDPITQYHSTRRIGDFLLVADERIIASELDWSGCRSIPRAMRRAQKYPQRTRVVFKPKQEVYVHGNQIIGHPEALRALVERTRHDGTTEIRA